MPWAFVVVALATKPFVVVALATEAINRLLQTGFAYYKRAEGHDLKFIELLYDMALN